jgi:replication-associated recombination protein RarA
MLTEKYRPKRIAEFAGLEKPRKILGCFVSAPCEDAWLFVGKPGTGKTTMGLALAKELNAQFVHIPSQRCSAIAIEDLRRECSYLPMYGDWRVVLVDEADQMTEGAQLALLSLLDSTARPVRTIFVFTANETAGLEPRFLSRCKVLEFSSYGLLAPAVDLLRAVWRNESGNMKQPALLEPDYARILKNNQNNIRGALQALEMELLAA